ncbi:PLP-dependent aminotransferase family protein [Rhodoferax aquaticus]|uniref:PLP-dependent aminotransferase family protein n=1 Tax=Rhodoferax aquaticus TaxID=2527691 RepID=A0A515EM20_9BURK|nr:PLP-dependent aminotransferase family protein [Rhodoferax aquaticus]QDL53708.1 PLP-dependent aminotransferase family protein [Rhodoferax aquaticus]
MDLSVLLATYAPAQGSAQRRLHIGLRTAILNGTLAAGTRLPPSRSIALELRMARNTVLYAYNQLVTEGLVHSDRTGTVVNALPMRAALDARAASPPAAGLSRRARAQHALPLASDLAGAFAPGVPSLAEFSTLAWRRTSERIWRQLGPAQLGYGDPLGEPGLRAAIADHLRASRGARCDAQQVFITDGTQSSLELCARAFADEGDTVWIENPGYGGALTAFRNAGLHAVGIPVDAEGIAPRAQDWAARPPKLIYVTPAHQYPTGGVLSMQRRVALLTHASQVGALVIEDDYDAEFRHEGPPLPAMQGLTQGAPVLYLGTFSKMLFPALRVGYVVTPPNLAGAVSQLVAHASLRGRTAEQMVLAEFMRSGQLNLHLRRMRRVYRARRNALLTALHQHLDDVCTIHGESAGMHLALCFKDPRTAAAQVSLAALRAGVAAPALSSHATSDGVPAQWNGLVLGYAQVDAAHMQPLVQTLASVIRQHTPKL